MANGLNTICPLHPAPRPCPPPLLPTLTCRLGTSLSGSFSDTFRRALYEHMVGVLRVCMWPAARLHTS